MEKLRQEIIKICNESGLPLEAILFVVRDVYRDVEVAFRQFEVQEQLQEKDNKGDEKE